MPRIDPDSVEQVRVAADLVELLRGRVELVRRSGRWWGRCPFHDERSPSFTILPDHRNYYCFGCGAKGDAISWMQEREGAASFSEAIEALADRFGIDLKYEQSSPQEAANREANQQRFELLRRARDFYASYLWKADDAEPARTYLAERGFDEELLRRYGVGYAPRTGGIAGRATQQGFSRQQLFDAGLARDRGGSVQDFFSSRIIFPIANGRGQVQGFGGRTLDPNERAKYVNSPEGRAFQKRRLLFALDQARASAAKQGWIAVAEGYTDVLALAKAGIDAAVACMGTSLTADQFRLLARTADEVRLCFDGDKAGQDAAWRSVEAAQGIAIRLTAVPLPPGRDPGDLAGDEEGLAALRHAVENPEPMMTYLVKSRINSAGPSAAERGKALDDISALLGKFPDSLEKDEAVRLATGLLGLSQQLENRLRQSTRPANGSAAPTSSGTGRLRLDADEMRERRWLSLATARPDLATTYAGQLSGDVFDLPEHREAFAQVVGGRPAESWPEELATLSVELRADTQGTVSEAELREATWRLQERSLERRANVARANGELGELMRLQDLLHRLRKMMREVDGPDAP